MYICLNDRLLHGIMVGMCCETQNTFFEDTVIDAPQILFNSQYMMSECIKLWPTA